MASYIPGYDEDRFVTKINRNFLCSICFNVLRDPVVCPKNQHCFCRSCITKYLKTAQRCPTCADHLTVETLVDATRIVKGYLNELNIRCVYVERGCQEILQLEQLDKHEATCGFTPVVCANEGCGVIVSRRDLIHHESELCKFRKLKCHSCEETTKTLSEMEKRMTKMVANMNEGMENIEKNMKEDAGKNKAELKQTLQAEMATLRWNMELNMQQNTAELQADMANLRKDLESRFEPVNNEVRELKAALGECFEKMKEVLVKMVPERKKEIIREGRTRPSGARGNIFVAGGFRRSSVEMFNWRQKVWSPLQSLPQMVNGATSFIYNNHMTIAGGRCGTFNEVDTMIGMNVESIPDLSTHWIEYLIKLPTKLAFHSSVLYNDQLIVTGGQIGSYATSDCIYEIQFSYPYTSKISSKMPEPRQAHDSERFDDNLLIVGGRTSGSYTHSLNSVLLYDIKKNDYKHLAPLPYEVSSFAKVKYGDNIVVIGGCDKRGNELNTVVMYNVVTQQSHMLPPMKCKREASAAVIVGNNIVVLGGYDGELIPLKSVEIFNFDTNKWYDFPEMSEERDYHTAVAV